MSSSESLHLIVEASLALAGFAGVITALAKRGARELSPLHRMSLVNLLATSLTALFLCLGALLMLAAGTEESLAWRITSGVGLVVTLYFASYSTRTVIAALGDDRRRGVVLLTAINGPLAFVCIAQLWNLATSGQFWPVFLLLVALFAIGCLSFVRLLLAPSG